MKANDLRDFATVLDKEAKRILDDVKSAKLSNENFAAMRRAIVEPREEAAAAIRLAATALDRIPPLGIGRS